MTIQPTSLSRHPTPIEPLRRLSDAVGIEIWVKRDDLTGLGLSGNKVRKLEWLLAEAASQGADTIITTGGLQSNHCRATAVACRRLGLEPVLLLRGEIPEVPDSNLLLDTLLGAEIHTCTAEAYRDSRDELMEGLAEDLRQKGRRPYIIPEGGSNGLGAMGFIEAAKELMAQSELSFDGVIVPVGSGGTLAGLAMGGLPCPVYGVAVCDDRPYFSARVHEIAEQLAPSQVLPAEGVGWSVVEGYQGEAYAVAGPEVWETLSLVARLEGLFLDPVYTGKAMHALLSEARAGRWTGRWLFWHTGGAFGLFGRGHEVR